VAENRSTALEEALSCSPVPQCLSLKHKNSRPDSNQEEPTKTKFDNMQVADSEDDEPRIDTSNDGNKNNRSNNLSKFDESCSSSCNVGSLASSPVAQELCEAILSAKQLKMIDLSGNGFGKDAVELLYSAWGSGSGFRGDVLTRKHITKDCIHFYVEGVTCCGVKPCCRRD
jgi:hypothetical protein